MCGKLGLPGDLAADRTALFFMRPLTMPERVRISLGWHAAYKLRNYIAHLPSLASLPPSFSPLSFLWSETKLTTQGQSHAQRSLGF